jgi:hypothetical protein
MFFSSFRRSILAIAAALAMLAAATNAALAQAPRFPLSSTNDCFKCHFGPPPTPQSPDRFGENRDFCHLEAAATWEVDDKHRKSLALLLNSANLPLTEQIVGFDVESVLDFKLTNTDPTRPQLASVESVQFRPAPQEPEALRVHEAHVATLRQCFACHAPVEERVKGSPSIENGVSCQACHGAGLAYLGPHQDSRWRLVKAADKEAEFGLRDLRSPIKRTALCASCHVGTFSQEWGLLGENVHRFVKHEWYAKGHPPLPGLEFVTFAAQQPAHWRTVQEKLFAASDFKYYAGGADPGEANDYLAAVIRNPKVALAPNYLAANPGSFSPDPSQDMARAKDMLISGLGVLKTYAELARDASRDDASWPDFAIYDCGACHHELRSKFPSAARPRRTGLPGRPPAAFWTLALARLGARQLGDEQAGALDAAVAEFETAFTAQPFGNREQIAATASKLAALCGQSGQALAAQPLDKRAAEALLSRLVNPENDIERDYHAARQYAWAIREVIKDLSGVPHLNYTIPRAGLAPPPPGLVPEELVVLLGGPRKAEVPVEHEAVRRRIDKLFDGGRPGDELWHTPLRLRLPAGQEQQVVGNLADWLAAIAAYDPKQFQERLEVIRAAVVDQP